MAIDISAITVCKFVIGDKLKLLFFFTLILCICLFIQMCKWEEKQSSHHDVSNSIPPSLGAEDVLVAPLLHSSSWVLPLPCLSSISSTFQAERVELRLQERQEDSNDGALRSVMAVEGSEETPLT